MAGDADNGASFKKLTDCDLLRLRRAEISDLHLGREDAAALEETGELQAGVAQRHAAQRGGGPGAEGGGERSHMSRQKKPQACLSSVFCLSCLFLPARIKEVSAK